MAHLSLITNNAGKLKRRRIYVYEMQRPIKKPNSRSGRNTDAKLAKKDAAVVSDVARQESPACRYKYLMREA